MSTTSRLRWSDVTGDGARWVKEHERIIRLDDALCKQHGLGRDGFVRGARVPIHPASRGGIDAPWDVWLEHMQLIAQDDLLCQVYRLNRGAWACGKRIKVERV